MIKQIKSSEIKDFIKKNSNTVLLDVRNEDELKSLGKPNAEDLNSTTYFITVSPDLSNWQVPDPKFVENVKKKIDKEKKILVMCAAGGRSMIAADLLEAAGYSVLNVSDGFSGNGQDPGWKNLGLPSVIDN
jgi:rhodanese-related sulfurtransferase